MIGSRAHPASDNSHPSSRTEVKSSRSYFSFPPTPLWRGACLITKTIIFLNFVPRIGKV
jgi:hypothetical protein